MLILLLVLGSSAYAEQANVFIYHRFNDSRYPSTNISSEDFLAQLEFLQARKITVLGLGQVIASLHQGLALPRPCAVITVDDAYRSFLTDGWSLLKRFGYPVTLFVSTESIGARDYLTWAELQSLQREGVAIGNHSASHAYLLDRLPNESDSDWQGRVSTDIMNAQQAFEDHLGAVPQLFAYPYGEFSPGLVELVKKAGFTAAFGQQSGVMTADQDLYSLPRFPMVDGHASLDEFRSKLFMQALPVRVVSPKNTVITGINPPVLRFYLNDDAVDSRTLRCFVSGAPGSDVRIVNQASGLYEASALQPLIGRRSNYTITASDSGGRSWFWYSQLWVHPQGPQMPDHSVPRRE